jgi:hypothetical protein
MSTKGFIAIAAAATAIYIFGKKRLVSSAKFSFEKISFNLKKKKINIILGIANPTSIAANINSIVGGLQINGQDVATVENYTKIIIEPQGKTMLPLTISPSIVGIFSLVKDYIQKRMKGKQATAKFIGTANIGGTSLPINISLI